MRRHAPRALLALTAFFILQGLPSGSAAACTLTGHHAAADGAASLGSGTPAVAMTGMSGISSTGVPGRAGKATVDRDRATEQTEAAVRGGGTPCGHDTSAPSCMAMPMCMVFVKSCPAHLDKTGLPVALAATMVSRAPAYVALPPDIPPPRA